MKTLFLAGAAALAVAMTPAAAQDNMAGMEMEMTAAQQAMYDGWTMENRTAYDAWPANLRNYYWTLTPTQQSGWWVLTDDQRTKVYAMTPDQRTAAWAAISTQMNSATPTATTSATTAATTGTMSGNMRWVSNEMVQTTAGDMGAPSGELPICSPDQQDNCINAWEAGKRGPGVTRPLDHWPGKPASEM